MPLLIAMIAVLPLAAAGFALLFVSTEDRSKRMATAPPADLLRLLK